MEKMTDKEIQASDEEMEKFNVLQNEKCVSVKTEKLNDLKNRISFALKDATLQQGFEIICKRIAELEKGNEELVEKKTSLEKRIFELENEIAELEKENADLKAEIGLNEATIQEQLKERVKVIKENEDLKKQISCYKAFESHYDEIEEDAKAIAKENAELKVQIEQMKCCGNCQSVFDADGFCYLYKDGKCINQSEWIKRSNKK